MYLAYVYKRQTIQATQCSDASRASLLKQSKVIENSIKTWAKRARRFALGTLEKARIALDA